MLYASLYVPSGFEEKGIQTGVETEYGKRVRKTYGPANLPNIIAAELQVSTGRTLISGEPASCKGVYTTAKLYSRYECFLQGPNS
jgi:hypothetical protein